MHLRLPTHDLPSVRRLPLRRQRLRPLDARLRRYSFLEAAVPESGDWKGVLVAGGLDVWVYYWCVYAVLLWVEVEGEIEVCCEVGVMKG